MKVNREELLIQLESILPGLSTKEIIEEVQEYLNKLQGSTFNIF